MQYPKIRSWESFNPQFHCSGNKCKKVGSDNALPSFVNYGGSTENEPDSDWNWLTYSDPVL